VLLVAIELVFLTGVLTIPEKIAVNSGDVTSLSSESNAETAI
jgi:hypothetical protein